MITMKEWMELVDYKITEGDSYGWSCFGPNAYQLSSWNGIHDKGGYSFNIVFSTKSHKVYCVEVCDYTNNRAYRMTNPDYVKKYNKEAKSRGEWANQAWDDVEYTNLEVDDDFIQKCLSIKAGEVYDTRVSVPLDLPDDMMFELMRMAHERDITLNQMVEEVLKQVIEQAESGAFNEEDLL